jgi:ABC-2 type transport system permease protein
MRAYWTLTRREFGSYFLSPTGYIIIAAATLIVGFFLRALISQVQQRPLTMPITDLFYGTWYFWLVLLLTTPVITMRLFALEKFTGTFETLMTAPVNDRQVVLAKFTASLVFYLVMWVPLQGCLFLVRHYSATAPALDAGKLASTILGITLLGGLFISLGCCASALTRSQVAAAAISLVFGSALFVLGLLADHLPSEATWQAQVLAALGFFNQMQDFVRGIVDTRAVVLYVTLTLFFLFVTLRIVESRRWK